MPASRTALHVHRFALGLVLVAGLSACGGGGGDAATSAVATSVAPSSGAALTNAATSTSASGDATGSVAAATTASTVTAWVRVALEGDAFSVSGTRQIRFGDGITWVTQSVSAPGACSVGFFGSDPAYGSQKFCEVQVTVPAVAQVAGSMPVINTALLPGAASAYATARVRALTTAELALGNFQPAASDIGAFREPCNFSHMAFDDPIVSPGRPGASHLHTFMGNELTDAASTADSIATSGGSTCQGGTLNRTAYWVPSMVDTRTGQPLVPTSTNVYYKLGYFGVAAGTVQAFPKGLRMVGGSAANTVAPGGVVSRFTCVANGTWQASIPTCAVGDSVLSAIVFPQCWDGVNLDSPDHKSHMAYATGAGCPADHPVPLPEVTLNVDYKVTAANNGDYWRLSSDNYAGPGGYSNHADWFGGWDGGIDSTFVARCINANLDCHDSLLGDGRILY